MNSYQYHTIESLEHNKTGIVVVVVVVHTSNPIFSFPGGDLVGLKPNPPSLCLLII